MENRFQRLSEKSPRVTPNEWRSNPKQEIPKKVLPVTANGLT
jgi:hypothetical protein